MSLSRQQIAQRLMAAGDPVWVARYLQRCVDRDPSSESWARAFVGAHQQFLFATQVPVEIAEALHALEPTPSGWLRLAADTHSRPEWRFCGERSDAAVATIEQALQDTRDARTRWRLASWLMVLSLSRPGVAMDSPLETVEALLK